MKLIMRLVAIAAASLLMLVAMATPAAGACPQGTVTPGNSEVDQYQETIPGSCGNQAPGEGSGGGTLPADTLDELNSLGDDGVATAGLASASAPRVEGGAGKGGSDAGSARDTADGGSPLTDSGSPLTDSGSPLTDSGSPLTAVVKALGGESSGGGLGLFLPLLLGGMLIAALVGLASRRRSV